MKPAVCPEKQIRGGWKWERLIPGLALSLWTAPDESWKPWQQAHTQESAKTLAPLKWSSMKRLSAPLFSHGNTTLCSIKTHRRMLTARTDVNNFRSMLKLEKKKDSESTSIPTPQGPYMIISSEDAFHIQKKGWKYVVTESWRAVKPVFVCRNSTQNVLLRFSAPSAEHLLPRPALESPLTPS